MNSKDKATVSAIVAHAISTRFIGDDGEIPWNIPEDMRRFRRITAGHVVIMGRKTWESLDEEYRPLPDRVNIVLTHNIDYQANGAILAHSVEQALHLAHKHELEEVFIMGGEEIYRLFLPYTEKLYVTVVRQHLDGKTHFPAYRDMFGREINRTECRTQDPSFTFLTLKRNH